MTATPGGLGRGLGALIREKPRTTTASASATAPSAGPAPAAAPADTVRVPVARVRAGVWQPRRTFRTEPLDELIASIRERGVLQPLLVRPAGEDYELIAGERRLRAAVAAGLGEVPVRVMAVDDREALELALVENLQREDLDPIEEAEGYRMLADRFALTQDQIADRVGRARASVTNSLRLLALPEPVRVWLADGTLSPGHGKALLGLALAEEQSLTAKQAVKEGWSVRETERHVARLQRGARRRRSARPDIPDTHLRDLQDKLQQKLGTAVHVHSSRVLANGKKAHGQVVIDFFNADDLDRLMLVLGVSNEF